MESIKELNFHGSDVEKVARHYQIPEKEIVNYGSNVNPLGLPKALEQKLKDNVGLVTAYPDPDYVELKAAIADYLKVDPSLILLGNGSTELIANYIDYINPRKALIVGPTYSEYEKKIRTLEAEVRYYRLREDQDFRLAVDDFINHCEKEVDLVVLCNPNNPTASLMSSHDLELILDYCKLLNIYMLIDETYMDFVQNASRVSAVSLTSRYSNIIVLRGFSKFFSAPGLRLGYGVSSDLLCHQYMEKQRHHWAINSLAAFAGKELMADNAFIEQSVQFIDQERKRMQELLADRPEIKVYPNKANFFFVRLMKSGLTSMAAFEYLIHHRMMIRNANSFPFLQGEYIRFCIRNQADNTKLVQHLVQYIEQKE